MEKLGIQGVKVELVEIKNNNPIVRATTTTNGGGWYGFTGFIPGDYTIRYTYGHDDATAMTLNSQYIKGVNQKSYNGQDYQSTKYDAKTGNYWYKDTSIAKSDATDDVNRRNQVIAYSKQTSGREITNHKAEVFKSYENPQPSHINSEYNRNLANELEQNTYRIAYTPKMSVEVEYATTNVTGNQSSDKYTHKIQGIDFGIVERPKEELTLAQEVDNVKVTLANGTELINKKAGKTDHLKEVGNKFDITLDDELKNGAVIEVTYKLIVTNNSEKGIGNTRAKNVINYVSNNLSFDLADNMENGKK